MKIYYIDLFCGAGGTSTGIHLSNSNATVLACVNHDKNAIESHRLNYPDAHHFTEDIRDFNVVLKLKKIVDDLRIKEPTALIEIWASLECTNFSNAKGGQPRDADSRTLAEHLFMYLEEINPDYLWIENVREFMSWGPLDDNGKPISKKGGVDYLKWIDKVCSCGYAFDYQLLNSANYGAFQSRERLFMQFARLIDYRRSNGQIVPSCLPIAWPEQTHTKDPVESSLFPMKKWNPVREILDLEDEGLSIFERKKPLSDKTIDVIIKGIVKAIAENEETFTFKYYGNGVNYSSLKKPSGTVRTKDCFAIIKLIFNQYKTGNVSSIEKPIGTVTTTPKCNVLSFILNPSHGGHTSSINKSGPTVIARQDKAPLYILKVIMAEYGIVDIKMRMAKIEELLQMQGFPKDYKLVGTQAERKKFIGNAVEVNQAKALIEAHYKAVVNYSLQQAT